MSGHSKWSQIKHQKGAADAKKSRIFSKLSRTISIAARKGENPDMNPELRLAVDKAKDVNMPSDNIERAIKRGTGKLEGAELEQIKYEAYGPGGSAIVIETITDNTNRTVSELKHIFSKKGAKLAEPGAVMWAFETKDGHPRAKHLIPLNEEDKNSLLELMEAIEEQDDVQEIHTNAEIL